MIIRDFYRRKNTVLEASTSGLIFHVSLENNNMLRVLIFSDTEHPERLNYFKVYLNNNSLVLQFEDDGITVSFSDNADFIRCMQVTFDECPADDVKTIFDTMFYIE